MLSTQLKDLEGNIKVNPRTKRMTIRGIVGVDAIKSSAQDPKVFDQETMLPEQICTAVSETTHELDRVLYFGCALMADGTKIDELRPYNLPDSLQKSLAIEKALWEEGRHLESWYEIPIADYGIRQKQQLLFLAPGFKSTIAYNPLSGGIVYQDETGGWIPRPISPVQRRLSAFTSHLFSAFPEAPSIIYPVQFVRQYLLDQALRNSEPGKKEEPPPAFKLPSPGLPVPINTHVIY
jgi:hypothetical protein